MSPILERIYGLMAERRMNAKYVSETLHLSNSSFTDWKKGKGNPGVEALTKMAELFNVSLDYLILGREAIPVPLPDNANPAAGSSTLVFSSRADRDLYDKFHRLPADCKGRVLAYLDGMLAALPASDAPEAVPVVPDPVSAAPEFVSSVPATEPDDDTPELTPVVSELSDGEERKSA